MGGEEVKIKCPECGGMYPQQDCGHQGLKLATLRAENVRLKADNLDLINNLEGEGYRLERLQARIAELKAALRPFAEYRFPEGEILRTSDRFHPMTYGTGELTVSDFRRAAAALLAGEEKE